MTLKDLQNNMVSNCAILYNLERACPNGQHIVSVTECSTHAQRDQMHKLDVLHESIGFLTSFLRSSFKMTCFKHCIHMHYTKEVCNVVYILLKCLD